MRSSNGTPLVNQTVTLLFRIVSGAPNGPVAYIERQVVSTNQYGLVNLVIGQGVPVSGSGAFDAVNWGGGAKFLSVSVETSPSLFEDLGTTQLMSVPYALYALNTANGGTGGGNDNWGTQTVQTTPALSGNGTGSSPLGLAQQGAQSGQVLKWDGSKWAPSDDVTSSGGNGGTITQINTGTGLTGGPITNSGTISLGNSGVTPGTYGSATQIPVISVDAQGRVTSVAPIVVQPGAVGLNEGTGIDVQTNSFNNFTLTNTGDVNAADDVNLTTPFGGDVTGNYNDLQIKPNAVGSPEIADNAVSSSEISANAVTAGKISNGAVTAAKIDGMGATSGEVLKWNGATWAPAADVSDSIALTSGTGITITGAAPNLTITNSGDADPSDDLTTASTANGDVSGPFSNLQLKADVVGTTELANSAVETANIANGAITGAKIDDMGAANGEVLKWNGTTWAPAADQGGTGGSFDVLPGTGIDVTTSGNTFIVINTGDTDATDDLTDASQANGDVTGPFTALTIKAAAVTSTKLAANAVTTPAIATGAITASKIDDMNATTGQVLRWNGTAWAPGTVTTGGGGDDWGAQTAVTGPALTGDGTVANPLNLAKQGASTGQVLRWNGTAWTPGTVTTGGGADDWGAQTAVTGPTLTGDGTAAAPLNLAKQGATNGQVLKWNGTTWAPGDVTGGGVGDDWGTQTAVTGPALSGNGTTASPLTLAKQGAQAGQVLKWNGTAWAPDDDLVGTGGSTDTYAAGSGISITGAAPNLIINNIGDGDSDPSNELQKISLSGTQLTLSQGGGTVTLPVASSYTAGTAISITGTAPNQVINNTGDVSNTNELQTINLAGNNLTLSNGGGTVTLPSATTYTAGTGIMITGTAPSLTIKNSGDLSETNELQNLSLTGTELVISGTNSSVDLSPLVSVILDEHWKLATDNLYNRNLGNVIIGTDENVGGKLQVTNLTGSGPAAYFTSVTGPALITNEGFVGINVSNPTFQLDVNGTARFMSNVAAPQLTVQQTGSDYARLSLKNSGANGWNLSGKGGAAAVAEFGIDFAGAAVGERAFTVKGNGNVGIGGLNNSASRLKVFHGGGGGLMLENTTNNENWGFTVNGSNGNLELSKNQSVIGFFDASGIYMGSDRDLKKEIIEMSVGVLHKVMQLQPVTYRYKTQNDAARRSMGFIAQDVQSLFPELVTRNARDGQEGYLAINYAGFGVLAVKAIQEQQTQLQALKIENEALNSKVDAMEARVQRLEQLLTEPKKN